MHCAPIHVKINLSLMEKIEKIHTLMYGYSFNCYFIRGSCIADVNFIGSFKKHLCFNWNLQPRIFNFVAPPFGIIYMIF
jgi:hypothetical protein